MSKLSDAIRKAKNTTCSAIVVAAGSSTRMGEDKLQMKLGRMPVLARTLRAIDACECVTEIVVVTRFDRLEEVAKLCRDHGILKCKCVVKGGAARSESSLAGLMQIDRRSKLVMIHDGARPLVTEDVVWSAVHGAALYKCAAPAIPVTDTIKRHDHHAVMETLPRGELAAIQTPQVFMPELIKAALCTAIREGREYSDDCAAVEAMGIPVRLTEGSAENIKITRPLDIVVAEAILKSRGELV